MAKIEYPKRIYTEVFAEAPFYNGTVWRAARLNEDGSCLVNGHADHKTEESCWIVCNAHNKRVGFSEDEVDQIINKIDYDNGFKKEKIKVKKGKKIKLKKKRVQDKDKTKSRKKRRLHGA